MLEKADYGEAVAAQPENLEQARACISHALTKLALPRWLPGESVAIVSMGASSHSANAIVAALTASGIRGMNLTASDLASIPAGYPAADHYVIVSESGRSPEPIAAARQLTAGRRIGITNFPASPLSEVVDFVIPLGGFLDSGVYTIGYTATLLAYSLLLEAVGLPGWATRSESIPELVRDTIARHSAVAKVAAEALEHVTAIDLVGRGFSSAAAGEGALLFREATRRPTAAFDTYQYLHGPMEGAGNGTGLIVLGDGRERTLIDSVLGSGARVVLVTTAADSELAEPNHEHLTVIRLPAQLSGFARAIVEIVVLQLIVGVIAESAGVPIGNFVYQQSDTKLAIN